MQYGSDPNFAEVDTEFDPIAAVNKIGDNLPEPSGLVQTETKESENLLKPVGMAQAKAKAKAKSHSHGHRHHEDSHPHFLAQQEDPYYYNYMVQSAGGPFGQAFGQVQG